MTEKSRPIVIDLEPDSEVRPETAPPVPEPDLPTASAVEVATRIAASRPSRVARLFWGALIALLTFALGVAAWDFVGNLLARNLWLGRIALGLVVVVGGALLILAGRELATLSRLRRIDGLRSEAEQLAEGGTLSDTRGFERRLKALYRGRPELRWGLRDLDAREDDVTDPEVRLAHLERTLMEPLDQQARERIEAAARQVATATAVVPLALADVVVALTSNLRMIRQIAQIYGGRAGTLGAWRLTKAVAAHLVATGAVAVGDDLVGSVAGGGVLSKVSRRFGEGVINGALTARVGVAAMEVCRPMPFAQSRRPRVSSLLSRALTGVFTTSR